MLLPRVGLCESANPGLNDLIPLGLRTDAAGSPLKILRNRARSSAFGGGGGLGVLGFGLEAVEGHIQEEDVDPGLAEETPLGRLDVFLGELLDLVFGEGAGGGDAGDLEAGGLGADVGVEAAGGGVYHVGGDNSVGGEVVAGDEGGNVVGDVGVEGAAGGAEVAAAGGGDACRAGAIGAGGRARPEVVGALELLRQEGGANDFAVLALHEASVGLFVEGDLGEECHDDRIDDSGDNAPEDGL